MNDSQSFDRPDYRKYRLLREALVDVRALVSDDFISDSLPAAGPAPSADRQWKGGLRLDGIANVAVLCTGVAIVVAAAASEGLYATLQVIA
jgi:hypothetical protein